MKSRKGFAHSSSETYWSVCVFLWGMGDVGGDGDVVGVDGMVENSWESLLLGSRYFFL